MKCGKPEQGVIGGYEMRDSPLEKDGREIVYGGSDGLLRGRWRWNR